MIAAREGRGMMGDADMREDPGVRCPVCTIGPLELILHREGVPVIQNYLFATPDAARAIGRGTLDYHACLNCTFVFNAAFAPELLEYGPDYENTQTHSDWFSSYVDGLVERLVTEHGVSQGSVLEVGSGKGGFLEKLLSREGSTATAVGFDPAYVGPDTALDGRIQFVREFFGPDTAVPADVVISRHVIEHIPDPLAFLSSIRAAIGSRTQTKLFIETPCVEWILEHEVSWDLFYEHCSLFTRESLGRVLSEAGFGVTRIEHMFGGQYLWAEATAAATAWPEVRGDAFSALAVRFRQHDQERVELWRATVDELRTRGSVAVWGAGAKGVTFCNLTDPQATAIAAVVDVNPAKQGKFLTGTGHRIITPEQAAKECDSVLVLNPNYLKEIAASLDQLGAATLVVDVMERG
jgi:SAM-dependent methyltransferase